MLPPKVSGTSDERTSPAAGARPTVPSEALARSDVLRRLPQKASSVHNRIAVPGLIR